MSTVDADLLSLVASKLGEPPALAEGTGNGSLLTLAASAYGAHSADATQPTGFDPQVAALFEAMVEGAFLVANADGEFDAAERDAFQHVVSTACAGTVRKEQVSALLSDLADQLAEDGLDKRVEMIGKTVRRPEHVREVLRIASLLAQVSGGVDRAERDVLGKLAGHFGLDAAELDRVVSEAERAVRAAP